MSAPTTRLGRVDCSSPDPPIRSAREDDSQDEQHERNRKAGHQAGVPLENLFLGHSFWTHGPRFRFGHSGLCLVTVLTSQRKPKRAAPVLTATIRGLTFGGVVHDRS